MSSLADRPSNIPSHYVPVTLFFIREQDDRAIRLRDWIDPEIIQKEACLTFILRQWGQLSNFRSLRFVFMVDGHSTPMVTNEIIRQYVAQAKSQSVPGGQK